MSLQVFDLSHPFHHHMPEWPSTPGVNVTVDRFHARDGVYQVRWEGIMHRGTHMDAPLHVTENTPTLTGYPLPTFFGTGVAVSIPKGKWEVITAADLENASPAIQPGEDVGPGFGPRDIRQPDRDAALGVPAHRSDHRRSR
mgnify:CR=1 FL=1